MLPVSGRSHTGERCAICKSFSKKLQRVRDSHLKMLLFEKSMYPSFDPELPWAETFELPLWKNTSYFTQLSNVLMVKFILCSGKTSSDKGKKEWKLQRQKRQRLSFPGLLVYRVYKSSQFLQIKVVETPKWCCCHSCSLWTQSHELCMEWGREDLNLLSVPLIAEMPHPCILQVG